MTVELRDTIHEAGRDAVLTGAHDVEVPPSISGRWGPSVVALPSGELAASLDGLTTEVSSIAGREHWQSGGRGRAHVTVRVMGKHAARPTPPDRIHRYMEAMDRALTGVGGFRLDFDGVVLSTAGVLAVADDPDGRADELRRRLGDELGPDGAFEDEDHERRPSLWSCPIVHFAGPIADPRQVVEWVDAHRRLDVGTESFDALALCRWNFDGAGMAPFELGYVG